MAKQHIIITGSKSLTRMLNALGSTKARAVHRRAIRKAARPILSAAKSNAPVDSGALRNSLTIRAIKKSRRGVGVRVTNKVGHDFKGKQFYGGFQEFGWKLGKRRSRTGGTPDNRRKIAGKWFMRNAGTEQEQNAIDIYESGVEKLIKAEASK